MTKEVPRTSVLRDAELIEREAQTLPVVNTSGESLFTGETTP